MPYSLIESRSEPAAFAREGYIRVRVTPDVVAVIEDIVKRARAFFRCASSEKQLASLPGAHEGWHAFGGEYSITPDRPDLHESFWVTRGREKEASKRYASGAARDLHGALMGYLDIVQDIERVIMADLLDWLGVGSHGAPPPRSMESDLQVLFYEPALQTRDLLQDAHEDGLSLTITWADGPGLELLGEGGVFQPAGLACNELAVLPGEILALMTGFKVRPQVHRVARHPEQLERFTVSYFASPDINGGGVAEPWVKFGYDDQSSLAEQIRLNRIKYLTD